MHVLVVAEEHISSKSTPVGYPTPMQLHPLRARSVCSAKLSQTRPVAKLSAGYPGATSARLSGVTPSECKLRRTIACCRNRNPGPSAIRRHEPDKNEITSCSNKSTSAHDSLVKAAEPYTAGRILLRSGQVRQGCEQLRLAQHKVAEAKVRLAVRGTYSETIDKETPPETLNIDQQLSILQLGSAAGLLTIWVSIGYLLGACLLLATVVGTIVTSLLTVSEYVTTISTLLLWYAILLVVVPQVLIVPFTRKNQTSLFGATVSGAQVVCYELLTDLASAEDPDAQLVIPRLQKSPSEYRETLLWMFESCYLSQVLYTGLCCAVSDDSD